MDLTFEMLCIMFAATVGVVWITLSFARARRAREHIARSFENTRFDTTAGPLRGADLMIISKRQRFMQSAYERPSWRGMPKSPSDAFWFCVGTGPSYFLAIPLYERRWGGDALEWILKPLTAERFRAALVGDRKALRKLDAFEASAAARVSEAHPGSLDNT